MKLLLQSLGGTQFPVEVGDSGTLQQLKEKVHETLDIPIARQMLSFNGNILREDTELVDVKNGSVIKFRILPAPAEFPLPIPFHAPEPEAGVIDLTLDIWPTERMTVKTCGDDTVYELKEKIQKKEGTPADQIFLTTVDGTELPDYKRVRDCDWETGMSLEFLPGPRPKRSRLSMMSSSSSAWPPPQVDADMLSLKLQFKGEKLPAAVEVRRWEKVKELRTKLDAMEFKVPGNREYRFVHDQDWLDEESSFASQNVAHGDLIRISTGYNCYLRYVS